VDTSSTNSNGINEGREDFLTDAKLHQWHMMLCEDLVPDEGRFRNKNVRVEYTHFCPHDQVQALTSRLLQAFQTLEEQVFRPARISNTYNNNTTPALIAVTRAAVIFVGVIDCHPYADGNGRLSRLAANWALRRYDNLPFVVQWFATPAQRAAYSLAVRQTRRNLDLAGFGTAAQHQSDVLLQAHQAVGCLQPIVTLLLDRVYKAVTEFGTLLRERESAHSEEAEARMARRFRERAAAGTCLICFDNSPNIATLCCGKAVHLNCMAQWLSNNSSCPQCRASLPSVTLRPVRGDDNSDNSTNDDTTDEFDDTLSTTEDQPNTSPVPPMDDDTTTTDDSFEYVDVPAAPAVATTSSNNNMDDTTTTISDADDTTSAATPPPPQREQILNCTYCNNRAARDCSNQCCGRCCVLHGNWQCFRHAVNN
jgi:fido (protein-threonine AMPylation protein)